MAEIIPFPGRSEAVSRDGRKITLPQTHPGPHPNLRRPYNRSEALAFMWWVPEEWRLDPIDLQYVYAPKKALQIVLKTRHAVRQALKQHRDLGRNRHWLYDPAFDINLSRIEARETDLAWRLYDCWQATEARKKPRKETAADAINAVRADLAAIMAGDSAARQNGEVA